MTESILYCKNGESVRLADIPEVVFPDFRSLIMEAIAGGAHVVAFFPLSVGQGKHRLFAVLADAGTQSLIIVSTQVGASYSSLTPEAPELHHFEREVAEQWGITPTGHPWLKPVRMLNTAPGVGMKKTRPPAPNDKTEPVDFFRVEGEEVHEVAVGPVHAGVIEPGHFRFQCHGETVFHLEISLGYQHRGIEKALLGGPDRVSRHRVETSAGDTACGHSLAYAMNVEALAGLQVDPASQRSRGVALELERLANHIGDMGALAGDVGFLPTASYCGRLRGDYLNLSALLCGNRFGRSFIVPGGVSARIEKERAAETLKRLGPVIKDTRAALTLLFHTPTAMARFEDVGCVSREAANQLGLVGPAARASGLDRDIRLELPYGPYARGLFEVPVEGAGDVLSRAKMRSREIDISVELIEKWLAEDCDAQPQQLTRDLTLQPDRMAISLTEGWRGEVCHVAVTNASGRFALYKIVDPSFHNWFGLAMALRGQQISDFPLCNKSFNLSYCGHDL